MRVHDAAGNSATLGFGVGCVGSSGAGDCRYVGPASFAASFPGVAAQELETGIRKLARPEAGRPAEPARAFATTSVACPGGGVFEISTGLGSGTCEVILAGGIVVGGRCRHDAGTPGDPADDSTSGVECSANGGRGSCTSASGSGTCIQRP